MKCLSVNKFFSLHLRIFHCKNCKVLLMMHLMHYSYILAGNVSEWTRRNLGCYWTCRISESNGSIVSAVGKMCLQSTLSGNCLWCDARWVVPDVGWSHCLHNLKNHFPKDMVSHPRRLASSAALLVVSHILHDVCVVWKWLHIMCSGIYWMLLSFSMQLCG